MKAEHVADFRALGVVALSAREPFEFRRGIRVRLGQLVAGYLRTEAVQEVDQDFEIRIHCIG